uniref:PPM-type phosphatase domain-containing protein n=1 Tax=Rhizophora mucronata TaxID=61149 RepID=A0A2P2IK63_RHIMU
MSTNGATKTASLYTQQGKKGTNQDAMLVWENFNSRSDTVFCGVFDGHGPVGHTVAKKVRDTLPFIVCSQWNDEQSGKPPHATEKSPPGTPSSDDDGDDEAYQSLDAEEGNEKLPEMCMPLKKSILKAFNLMDKELKLHPTIDCFCSGTTAVTLIKQACTLFLQYPIVFIVSV